MFASTAVLPEKNTQILCEVRCEISRIQPNLSAIPNAVAQRTCWQSTQTSSSCQLCQFIQQKQLRDLFTFFTRRQTLITRKMSDFYFAWKVGRTLVGHFVGFSAFRHERVFCSAGLCCCLTCTQFVSPASCM